MARNTGNRDLEIMLNSHIQEDKTEHSQMHHDFDNSISSVKFNIEKELAKCITKDELETLIALYLKHNGIDHIRDVVAKMITNSMDKLNNSLEIRFKDRDNNRFQMNTQMREEIMNSMNESMKELKNDISGKLDLLKDMIRDNEGEDEKIKDKVRSLTINDINIATGKMFSGVLVILSLLGSGFYYTISMSMEAESQLNTIKQTALQLSELSKRIDELKLDSLKEDLVKVSSSIAEISKEVNSIDDKIDTRASADSLSELTGKVTQNVNDILYIMGELDKNDTKKAR